VCPSDGFDSRNATDSIGDASVELFTFDKIVVRYRRKVNVRRKNIRDIKSGIEIGQTQSAATEQAGNDQQYSTQSNLSTYQHGS